MESRPNPNLDDVGVTQFSQKLDFPEGCSVQALLGILLVAHLDLEEEGETGRKVRVKGERDALPMAVMLKCVAIC